MMDADRYWAASGLLTGNSPSVSRPPTETKPGSGVAAEQLDGGCLLYRLPAARGRDTDPGGNPRYSDC
jgi:hypothetical protein